MRIASIVIGTLVFLLSGAVRAERIEIEKLPPSLRDWVEWVLFDAPERDCVLLEGERICLWPGRLTLSLNDGGGTFAVEAAADIEGDSPLPGNGQIWPQDVTLDGKPVVVEDMGGLPTVRLLPGVHLIEGRFQWDRLPEGIDVPAACGIIDLSVNGKTLSAKRDESGRLWLASAVRTEEEELMDLSVWRKITDAIPVRMETRIGIRASGKAREVLLDNVLPDGTAPLAVNGDLPARLDPEGNLKLQLRPGNHLIYITARVEGNVETLGPRTHTGPWPTEEIWTWQADNALRQVKLDGAPGIDPSRTDLPEEWRTLPAYVLTAKSPLKFTTARRGEAVAPPDRVSLKRTMWMDMDGGGFSIRDSLTGTLNRTWRLDLAAKGTLGRVTVDGEDRLITQNQNGQSGVELRKSALTMSAEWHTKASLRDLPASGWSEDTAELETLVHLPPGWTLLYAGGVDTAPNTWWDKWDLFGFFFVLIISIAAAKLTRPWWGIIALFGLLLSYHEPEVPLAVWPIVIIALALLKVLKQGKPRIGALCAFFGAVLWLISVLVPFAIHEIRTGLYPQISEVELQTNAYDEFPAQIAAKQEAAPAAPEARQILGGLEADNDDIVSRKSGIRGPADNPNPTLWQQSEVKQDPKAVVQTGMGLPSWQWNSWQLTWSGPVKKNHQISLFLISPSMHVVLSFLRAVLLTLLGLILIREGARAVRLSRVSETREPPTAAVAAGTIIGLFAVLLTPCAVHAGGNGVEEPKMPPDNILSTLRERLTAEPECRPNCVSVSKLHIEIVNERAVLTAEVHAEATDAVQIPGPAENWVPKSIEIDGRPSAAVVLRNNGFLHVRIPKGIHKLTASGPMPQGGGLILSLGQTPKQVTVNADGWTVDGRRENNRAESSLQFTRIASRSMDTAEPTGDEATLPPWLEITREINLGIPWTMLTTVNRISPVGSPILVTVPLLQGESVTQSELKVTADGVVVSLGREDAGISWTSILKEQQILSLTAEADKPWSEVWRVACSPIWQCDFEGIAPINRTEGGEYKPVFKPWPTESVSVHVAKANGVDGVSTTVDAANLRITPGIRLSDMSLKLDIRTSRGGEQKITLPQGAEIQTVTVDGSPHPFQQSGRQVVLSLKTGKQTVSLDWQMPAGLRTRFQVPAVKLDRNAANVHVTASLPRDRWLLLAGGPAWGPAILFWGYLIAVLAAGFILGRTAVSPIQSHQWMLLFAGLTQVPVPVALIIVLWFIIVHKREKKPFEHRVLFNLTQVGIGILTAAAVGCLTAAVYTGLAVQPDMQVEGMGSSNTTLVWYTDRVTGDLPTPWFVSVPLLVWKVAMLAWALWLAASTVRWARWAWRSYTVGGIWRKKTPLEPNARKVPGSSGHPPLPNSGEETVS